MADEKKQVKPDVQLLVDPPVTAFAEVLVPSETMHINSLSQKTKDYLSNFEEEEEETNKTPLGTEKPVVLKSRQDFLDEMTLMHAHHDTPSKLSPDATPEKIAAERERRLNALTTRHRVVFSQWPRDPDTKHFIKPENSVVGKTAANGLQLWGATMFDFYAVLRHPSIPNLRTLSVGSKLLGWVKKVGEDYELARSTYEWAEREEDPKTFEPCDIEVLIREGEAEMRRAILSGEIAAYEAKEREELRAELEKLREELRKREAKKKEAEERTERELSAEKETPSSTKPTDPTEEKAVAMETEEQTDISSVESRKPQSPNEGLDSIDAMEVEINLDDETPAPCAEATHSTTKEKDPGESEEQTDVSNVKPQPPSNVLDIVDADTMNVELKPDDKTQAPSAESAHSTTENILGKTEEQPNVSNVEGMKPQRPNEGLDSADANTMEVELKPNDETTAPSADPAHSTTENVLGETEGQTDASNVENMKPQSLNEGLARVDGDAMEVELKPDDETPAPPTQSTQSTEAKEKVIGETEEQNDVSNVGNIEPQPPNEGQDSGDADTKEVESKPDDETRASSTESTHSTEENGKVTAGTEEETDVSNVESLTIQPQNAVLDGDAMEVELKPDHEKKQGPPIPTNKMARFSIMGEMVGDFGRERELMVKSDAMEVLNSTKMDVNQSQTLASQSNDTEMKEECEQKSVSDSNDVDMKEEEPATEPKGNIVLEEAMKTAPEPKDVPLPADEGDNFAESPEITYPIGDLFDQNCYPKGWVREPFTNKLKTRPLAQPQNLQKYIPQRLLPKKLVVHDPWNLLQANEGLHIKDIFKPWTQKEDITHVYKLQTSTTFKERRKEDDDAAEKEDAKLKSRLKAFLADPHSKAERPNGFEMVVGDSKDDETVVVAYIVLPEVPRPAPVNEAHLYLSPSHSIGVGNHSFVYDAVFEVPRSLLVKEELCMDCVHADVEQLLNKRVEDLRNARPGKLIAKTKVIPPYVMTCPRDEESMYLLEERSETTTVEYEGPYDVVVQTRVRYQNPERAPYCEHLKTRETSIHPLTTKVSVAAKLSLEGDSHLRLEAYNYQRFPKHFFEHWSGYNIIRPFHQPVPLGAIVPQFYGYYVIDADSSPDYMSPILLIEKCGTPINFESLSIDDKQECASLLYRFHEGAWTHGSVYERNIIRQPGPITAFPDERTLNKAKRGGYGENWSYRLIDFGRSVYVGDKDKGKAQDMVRLDAWKMDKWANGFEDTFR